jgi:hypothetical protein
MNIILIATLLSLLTFSKSEENPAYKVFFHQEGKKIEVVDHEVSLKKKPFEIEIEMSKKMGIFVHSSFKSKTYKMAIKNEHIGKLEVFNEKGMIEEKHNPDKTLLINDDAPSYWFYSSEENNRFDKTVKDEYSHQVNCFRTVKTMVKPNSNEIIEVEEAFEPVYMVFMVTEVGNNSIDKIEVQREAIKVNWIDKGDK